MAKTYYTIGPDNTWVRGKPVKAGTVLGLDDSNPFDVETLAWLRSANRICAESQYEPAAPAPKAEPKKEKVFK